MPAFATVNWPNGYSDLAPRWQERRKRCGRISRRIALLRAHGLVAKVPRSRRYRVTPSGQRFMSTAIHVRAKLFAKELTALS